MRKTGLWLFSFVILVSCGSLTREQRYKDLKALLQKEDYKKAEARVLKDRKSYGDDDKLVFLMDLGIIQFYQKQYQKAINTLTAADDLAKELYTQSVTANVSTYLLNDNFADYQGEDHELIYLNIYKALAFVELRQYESAMVEIRQAQEKINILETKYRDETESFKADQAKENKDMKGKKPTITADFGDYPLSDSGISRLLGFLLYRIDKEADDARIDKEKLQSLWQSLPTVYDFKTPKVSNLPNRLPTDSATLDLVISSGFVSSKISNRIDVTGVGGALVIHTKNKNLAKMDAVAFPAPNDFSFSFEFATLSNPQDRVNRVELWVDGAKHSELLGVENTSNLAKNTFEGKQTFLFTKSLVRSLTKSYVAYHVGKAAKKEIGNNLLGSLASAAINVGASLTESADIRGWNLMANQWRFAELKLPFGTHKIELKFFDYRNNLVKSKQRSVDLSESKQQDIIYEHLF